MYFNGIVRSFQKKFPDLKDTTEKQESGVSSREPGRTPADDSLTQRRRSSGCALHNAFPLLCVLFSVSLCLCCFILGGCKHMTLTLKADYNANRGQPVYVLIRSVNEKAFLTESYQDISNMIFKDPPDPSILSYQVLLPGQKQKIKIEKPENASVGVYGLFTEPDEEWKMLLPQPFRYRYLLTLERNRMVETTHE